MFPGGDLDLTESKLFVLVRSLLEGDYVYRAMEGSGRSVEQGLGHLSMSDREGIERNLSRYLYYFWGQLLYPMVL